MVINMDHQFYMREALTQAQKALELGEVPIGAVLVKEHNIIARDFNYRENSNDPTAHAELRVIRKGAKLQGNWRLPDCTLYVTLEPCPMCAGAILNSRIKRLVFGAFDPKGGAAGTIINLLEDARFNHRVEIISGVLEEDCKEILQSFFKNLRKK